MAKKKEAVRKEPSKVKRFAEMVSSAATREQETKTAAKNWIQNGVNSQVARFKSSSIGKAAAEFTEFATFERWLAALLIFSPIFLIVFNGWPTEPEKGSISAYYEMTNPSNLVAFYFPLTAAAMLFIVNGFVKRKEDDPWHSYYNVYLGIMLSGVILFNHNNFSIFHNIFAGLFFVGNVIVIYFKDTKFFHTKRAEGMFDWTLIGGIVLSFILFWPFKVYTLFFLEWISLALISLHFILLSKGTGKSSNRRQPARI